MPKPPVNPDYLDQVNYVIDSWSRPCEAPWYIYIETLWPALLEAFIMFVSFGWGDVARGFARPRGLTPRRFGKKKGRWAKKIPRFPEIGNLIGANLPGAEQAKGIKYGTLGKTLWRIDGQIQAGLFWWLVADITIDFAFNWTSLLYETEWCKASAAGRFSYQQLSQHPSTGGRWSTVEFPTEDYDVGFPTWQGRQGFSGPRGCTVGVGMELIGASFPARPYTVETRVKEIGGDQVFFGSSLVEPTEVDDLTMAMSGSIPPNKQFEVQVNTDADFALFGPASVTGMED